MNRIALIGLLSLGFGAQTLSAQTLPDIADTDGNGLWSLEEMQVAYPDLTQDAFTALDANADGGLDAAEVTAAVAEGTLLAKEG
jgi:hypothetical protein